MTVPRKGMYQVIRYQQKPISWDVKQIFILHRGCECQQKITAKKRNI